MVTKRYLETVTGTDRYEIPQPTLYPTAYAVRDVPSDDAIAITIEAFTPVGRTEQH